MTINELAAVIHENAVAHGWWDDERKAAEIVALIHSEWSEALEEARAGRPLVWYMCSTCEDEGPCVVDANAAMACGFDLAGKKPEGVAVELIDGCIRILDAFDFFHVDFNGEKTIDELMDDAKEQVLSKGSDISTVVAYLHYETSMLFLASEYKRVHDLPPAAFLIGALGVAFSWVREQGPDPMTILLEKHEYNKTRPYKHGKKF